MRANSAARDGRQRLGREAVNADTVRVGKDVIELLTSGMYVSPVTIYREYIQNAADAVDAARAGGHLRPGERGRVSVRIEHAARSVTVRDNGAGLAARDAVSALLAIGGSSKRGTQARGFRGVGRLSGLAYCRELEFRTKALGEGTVVSVVWDCRALRTRLADGSFDGDLRRIVSDVVTVSYEPAEYEEDHFFEVHLREVARYRNDLLLNERIIANYLGQVGPVPFAPEFSFAAAIEERLTRHTTRVPVDLSVQDEPVYRPYRDETPLPGTPHKLRIEEVEFFEFADVDGRVGAVAWIGHHEYVRSISTSQGIRGLRARIGDVQVGEANLFEDVFRESRFNGWTIGEIHVLDCRIVPNARRDNFEVNHHAYNLLTQLGPVAAKIAQRCRSASVSRNTAQIIKTTIDEAEGRLAERRPISRAELSKFRAALHRCRTKLKSVADSYGLRSALAQTLDRLEAQLASCRPRKQHAVVALDEALALVSKYVTNRDQARRLDQELRRICG